MGLTRAMPTQTARTHAPLEGAPTPNEPRSFRVDRVSKKFGDATVLHDVTLELAPASVHALLGHNGSGKSTLIKILAGFYEADPGATVSDGDETAPLTSDNAPWRERVKFIHQDLGLVETLGVIDNLALGRGFTTGRFQRILWRAERARARAWFDRLGMHPALDSPLHRLSAVERTAVAVVRALLDLDPADGILVLDEPTASLSAPEADQLYGVIRNLTESGVTVLLVTHRLNEVEALSDHVTVLRDGSVVADRPASGLSQRELVEYITGEAAPAHSDDASAPALPVDAEVKLQTIGLTGTTLHGLDLNVHAGEIVGIAGVNGSGRDEIANLLVGVRDHLGHIKVGGRGLSDHSPREAFRVGLAFVPADRAKYGVIGTHSVKDNISLTDLPALTRYTRIDSRKERTEALRWMKAVALPDALLGQRVDRLSGGSQQKTVIAKWLRRSPAVLILDEPTQGVDVAAKRSIHELVRAAATQGTAVLMCSSDNEELAELSDRVLVLRRGKVAAELRGPALTDQAITDSMLREEE